MHSDYGIALQGLQTEIELVEREDQRRTVTPGALLHAARRYTGTGDEPWNRYSTCNVECGDSLVLDEFDRGA